MRCLPSIILATIGLHNFAYSADPTLAPTSAAPTTLRPSSTPVAPIDFCFNMGHKPGVDYVIKNGNATKVPDHELELYTVFYAWLDAAHEVSNCSGIHNWTVVKIDYPALITAEHKQEGDGRALPLNASNVTNEALTIDWKCTNQGKEFHGIVNITIGIGGDTQYSDIIFSVDKTCFPHLTPTPEPPKNTGWGAGSIFFFTVFILTMVFCIVGCGINYVQQGKTGLEIIPGASTCVACMGKLFRQPRYTPQMDYDAPVGGQAPGNERFGASYQTDL